MRLIRSGPTKVVPNTHPVCSLRNDKKTYTCAILLLLFYLFYVLESNFVLFEPYVSFLSFSYVRETEWPPIGK